METCKVVLVKHGKKYNHEHVNKLSEQLSIYFNNIYCYTEDPTGVNVECIDTGKPKVTGVWNKLKMFSDSFPLTGECVFFDLDSKINYDPTPFLEWHNEPTVISSYWKRDQNKYYIPHHYDTVYNSSIITWIPGTTGHIWNKFMTNPDYFTRKYKGIDRFLMWEDIKINTFRDGIVNSIANPIGYECPIDTYNGISYEHQAIR